MATTPDTCPVCGADVPAGAKACPECGSDEETGWSDQARYDGLDLPNPDFDYDDFVKKEFGGESKKPRGLPNPWWGFGLPLLVIVIIGLIVLVLLSNSR